MIGHLLTTFSLAIFVSFAISPVIGYACHEGVKHNTGAPCKGDSGPTLEERVTALEGDVSALQTDATTLQTDVTTLGDDIVDHEDRIASLEERVDALEQASNGLAVVDANDNKVGDVLGVDFRPFGTSGVGLVFIAFRVNQHAFVLGLTRESFFGSGTGISGESNSVAFESIDCSGTPYVRDTTTTDNTSVFPITQVVGPGSTVYIQEPEANSQLPTLQSVLTTEGSCESTFLTSTRVFPAVAVIDLNTLYTPPFILR